MQYTSMPPPCWKDSSQFEPGHQECGKAREVFTGLNSRCPTTPNLLTGNFLDSFTNKTARNEERWPSARPPAPPGGTHLGPRGVPAQYQGTDSDPHSDTVTNSQALCTSEVKFKPGILAALSDWIQQALLTSGGANPLPRSSIPSAKKNHNLSMWPMGEEKRAIQIFLNKIMSAIKEQSCWCHSTPWSHRAGRHEASVGRAIGDISYATLGTVAK